MVNAIQRVKDENHAALKSPRQMAVLGRLTASALALVSLMGSSAQAKIELRWQGRIQSDLQSCLWLLR